MLLTTPMTPRALIVSTVMTRAVTARMLLTTPMIPRALIVSTVNGGVPACHLLG